MPEEIHPEVAAALQDARRTTSIMDDQLHKMDNARFKASDEAQTVEVTLDGHHQLIDVFIDDGLLGLGEQTVEGRLNEALRNATKAATASIAADQQHLDELITEATDGRQ